MDNIDFELLEKKLNKCKNIKLEDVDINTVDDLENIKINRKKSSNERIIDFINNCANPYIFKVNGRLVKFEFSNNEDTAENCLTKVIKSLYQ